MKKAVLKKIWAFICAGCLTVSGICFSACQEKIPEGEISVYMPDGAPSLAFAKLLKEDSEEDGVAYRVVKNDLIASKVTNKDEEKNADLCVMPLTAAAKILGSGERYVMLGAVTHGNLFVISEDGTPLTAASISLLQGKTVGVLQIDNLPGLVFKSVLTQYGLTWTTDGENEENAVRLEGILRPNEIVKGSRFEYYVLAEPAVSVQVKKNGFSLVGDLQTLYGGKDGYPQAVLVAKKELAQAKAEWINEFVQEVAESAEFVPQMTGEEIVAAVTAHLDDPASATTLNAGTLSYEVLTRCGVRYVAAKNCGEAANALLEKFLKIQPMVTAIPAEGFYWQ